MENELDNMSEIDILDLTVDGLLNMKYSIPLKDMVQCPKCRYIFDKENNMFTTTVSQTTPEYYGFDNYGETTTTYEKDMIQCPNCHKQGDDDEFGVAFTDDIIYAPNAEDLLPGITDATQLNEMKGGNNTMSKIEENKTNLQEATIKALYDGLKDDTEINDVEGLVDDVLVVTDPEITTDEYNEIIDRAQEIIEDTPEGDIPLDPTYLGEYLQICPICGGSFIEDHILEPGTACPICYETPESFVMVGKLQGEDDVAEDNGLVDETDELSDNAVPMDMNSDESDNIEPIASENNSEETISSETDNDLGEEPTENNRPRGARLRRNREVASKEIPIGNKLTENKDEKLEETHERYKVSFYVDSTETPKDEIKNKLNDALAGTGLASGKDDIEIELYDTLEESDDELDKDTDKELLLGDEANDTEINDTESKNKEFELVTITPAESEKINELTKNSAFTWEGMNISDDNLQAIVDDLKENTKIKLPVVFYTWKGELFNDMFELTEKNAYPDDLNFLAIDLDNWEGIGNLPMYKMQVQARWLDDIVDNNKYRQDVINGVDPDDDM